jgi:hypothetical protein
LKLAGLTLALIAWSPSRPAPAPKSDGCTGFPCEADYVVWPGGGFCVAPIFESDGRGRRAEDPCAECRECFAIVQWSYNGPNCFMVDTQRGSFYGFDWGGGIFDARNDCDGIPHDDRFCELNVGCFSGNLFCNCQEP